VQFEKPIAEQKKIERNTKSHETEQIHLNQFHGGIELNPLSFDLHHFDPFQFHGIFAFWSHFISHLVQPFHRFHFAINVPSTIWFIGYDTAPGLVDIMITSSDSCPEYG
jgi:hypothetical protein